MLSLAEFDVSPTRGFLPETDPMPVTGESGLDSGVGRVVHALPKLLTAGRVRAAIEAMPEVAMDEVLPRLGGPGAVNAVMRAYSYLAHAYVWGEGAPATRLPRNLAVPFVSVATELGRPPVLSYASYALDNWTRIDPAGPVALGNIVLLQNFLGGLDEEWFVLVHVEIEARAAAALADVPGILQAVSDGDAAALESGLGRVAETIEAMTATLARMPEGCDPYIYYTRVRPYIHGWKDNPALPEGLVYEGVAGYGGRPQRFRGETGAQSGIVPTLDALLEIEHGADDLRAYLAEMRDYMPPGHRAFLAAVEDRAKGLRALVAERGGSLAETYNACVEGLYRFRAQHLEFAARYIHKQAEAGANSTAVGTGGTPFMDYLKKHRDDSARHLVR